MSGSSANAGETVAPDTSPTWSFVAAGLLGAAIVAVVGWIVLTRSGADAFDDHPAISVPDTAFNLVRGVGHREKSTLILEAIPGGIAVLSARIPPFQAENYPRVEWDLRSAGPPAELAFIWRTRENPGRNFSKPMQWLVEGAAPLDLADDNGWRGTITGVGLIARGPLTAPLTIASLRLPSASAASTLGETFAQWTANYPFRGYSVAFPFDAERFDYLPLTQAVAAAVGLALLAYVLLMRKRARSADARVLWAIFAGGWLLLDARWLVNLGHETALAASLYAGKNEEQKLLAARDAPLFALAQEIRQALPALPARVLVLCDSSLISVRIAYFLYPYNVYHLPVRAEGGPHPPPPDPSSLHSGEYVALVFYRGLGYDGEKNTLVWPDGRTLPAEPLFSKPGTLLLRIR